MFGHCTLEADHRPPHVFKRKYKLSEFVTQLLAIESKMRSYGYDIEVSCPMSHVSMLRYGITPRSKADEHSPAIYGLFVESYDPESIIYANQVNVELARGIASVLKEFLNCFNVEAKRHMVEFEKLIMEEEEIEDEDEDDGQSTPYEDYH